MVDNHWVWPERRDLYSACLAFADPLVSAARVREAADTLLNDLELYEDPDQGRGAWLFRDEAPIVDNLATKLHTALHDQSPGHWGHALMRHSLWRGISSDARHLLTLICQNGQGSAMNFR